MSFFAQLLAGAATGIGKGMVDQADYNDKLAAQQELLKEKHANALQLQSQRADDRLFQAQTLAALKGGSSGGSGGGDPIMGMLRAAKTPEEQQQAIGYIRALAGDDAAASIEANVFGRIQPGAQGMPTEQDVLASGPPSDKPMPPQDRVSYDRLKGQQALNRVYALLANKGETKNFAEGEQIMGRTDLATEEVKGMMKDGKPLSQASDRFNEVTNSAKVNPLGQQYADNKAAELALRLQAIEDKANTDLAKGASGRLQHLEQERTKAVLKLNESRGDAKKAVQKEIDYYDSQINAMSAAPATAPRAPAASTAARGSSSMKYDPTPAIARFKSGQPAR